MDGVETHLHVHGDSHHEEKKGFLSDPKRAKIVFSIAVNGLISSGIFINYKVIVIIVILSI